MSRSRRLSAHAVRGGLLALCCASGCVPLEPQPASCGPTEDRVSRVIDGDTVELATGYRVRYLLIDAPESTSDEECWGEEARLANEALVDGRAVTLTYDEQCEDAYGRLLAYVWLDARLVNRLLVERGHACVLVIPPNESRRDELLLAERAAQSRGNGLWAVCRPRPPC